jgi:hypothetical protein
MGWIYIRVNGTGNAWPVPLGSEHPFYDIENQEELANVSFSIIKSSTRDINRDSIEWEILVDAGHGVVQYLIRHHNRLPEAIVLTHAHLDHTLSLDWIMQSHYKHYKKKKKMPLFASRPAWSFVEASFPQLTALAGFHELKPGVAGKINGIPELSMRYFPVYHGERANGPGMLVFEVDTKGAKPKKIIFTGDILCPLLRKADFRYLQEADYLFTDANNRFPYPASNHWSISVDAPEGSGESGYLREFREQISCTHLIAPHIPVPRDREIHAYFDEFLACCNDLMPLSVLDFTARVRPRKVLLVHYGGIEDRNHHGQEILNPFQLENWAGAQAETRNLESQFIVPRPGDLFPLE